MRYLSVFGSVLSVFSVLVLVSTMAAAQQRAPVALIERPGAKLHNIELVQAGKVPVDVEIVSACVDGAATFKITNRGQAWPQLGTLKVLRVTDGTPEPMAQRKMRFVEGQAASFRFRKAAGERIVLFVEPSWYERPFAYDAEVRCEGN